MSPKLLNGKVLTGTVAALAVLLAGSARAEVVVPNDFVTQPMYGTVVSDGTLFSNQSVSSVTAHTPPDQTTGKGGGNWVCKNFDDPNCQSQSWIDGTIILSPCSKTTEPVCIDSLSIGRDGEKLSPSTLAFEALSQKIPASPLSGVPAGGSASLWKSDGVPNTFGTNDYLVVVAMTYAKNKGTNKATLNGFTANVLPAQVRTGDTYYAAESFSETSTSGMPNAGVGWRGARGYINHSECEMTTDGYCFIREDFSPNTKVSINLHLNNTLTGWLFGRLKTPSISVTKLSDSLNQLTVEALPTIVPNLVGAVLKAELAKYPKIENYLKGKGYPGEIENYNRIMGGSGFDGSLGSGMNNLERFTTFEDVLKVYSGNDSRFQKFTRWTFGSTQYDGSGAGSNCFSDKTKLVGIVTTNSPFYESGPPKFKDDSLNYVVAGPHFDADGKTLFSGVYDLNMRSEAARCLYGFSAAPLKAVVSVTSADGSNQDVQTEALSEKDGWLHLGAYNFHFSQPTIRIKLSQEKTVVPATTPAATPTTTPAPTQSPSASAPAATKPAPKASTPAAPAIPNKSKTITITCVKGNTTKRVIGANPICPTGYKKK
jgi:hypothetical protein